MYCQKCGNLIVDGEKFCRSCGTPARIQAGPVPEQQQKKKPGAASIIFPIVFATVVIIGAIIAISNLKASHESDESSSSAPVAETGVTPTPVASAPVADTEPETAPPAAVETDWRTIYLTYVLDNSRGGVFSGYKLVFIDDDDIPELVADSGRYPSGLVVMTIHNGEIIEYSGISDFSYIERSGLIFSDGGISGYYPASVIELKNGKFTEIFSGHIGEEIGEDDQLHDYYFIGDEEVTEEEYNAAIKKVFDKGKSLTVRDYISRDEIMKVL